MHTIILLITEKVSSFLCLIEIKYCKTTNYSSQEQWHYECQVSNETEIYS